jgi:hypothetical protein
MQRLDAISQHRLQQFARKVTLFATFAVFLSILQTRSLVLVSIVLQTQFLVASGFSILMAALLRQSFDMDRVTYWDEALAFSGAAMLSHFATRLAQSL